MDFNFSPDMGRMNPRWPWVERTTCSPDRIEAGERSSNLQPDRYSKTERRRSGRLPAQRLVAHRGAPDQPHRRTATLEPLPRIHRRLVTCRVAYHGELVKMASSHRLRYVWDPAQRTIKLRCSTFVHSQNVEWLEGLLAWAVAIQAADAHFLAESLAIRLSADIDTSAHPKNGARGTPDEMLGLIQFLANPHRTRAFTKEDFKTASDITPEPWVMANAGDDGLSAEFPFPGLGITLSTLGLGRASNSFFVCPLFVHQLITLRHWR